MYVPPKEAFITLKDHKPNFINDPTCRLLNPTKVQSGKISKQILSRVVEELREKTKLQLWKNTDSVIDWFEKLPNKKSLRFVSFDIQDYYGSITKKLFTEAIDWAQGLVNISDEERNIIFKSKGSWLFDGVSNWKKRGNSESFDIQMGAWDSAESTDIVGLFLLNKLKNVKVNNMDVINVGIYRDDCLLVCRLNPRLTQKLVDKLVDLFHEYKLKIVIDANHKVINFLDITMNLNTGSYQSYMKPNNVIKYIHTKSNHPKNILANCNDNINGV